MADFFISDVLPFMPFSELLGVVARCSAGIHMAALHNHQRYVVSWQDDAMVNVKEQFALAVEELGNAAFERTLEQLHWASNVNDTAQLYNDFCDVGLERSADDRVVRRSKLVKVAFRDCITRSVCLKVGFSDREKFDAEMEGIFRERFCESLRSQFHNAYHRNVREACLRCGFTSQSKISNERIGRVRPRRERQAQ